MLCNHKISVNIISLYKISLWKVDITWKKEKKNDSKFLKLFEKFGMNNFNFYVLKRK